MIGRVSPPAGDLFLVATKKGGKEAPRPQRRLAPVPRSTRVRRVASKTRPGAQTSTRQFRRSRAAPGAAEGALPARLRHCRRAVVPSFRHGIRARFVAPAQAGVQALILAASVLGLPSVGGDWPGLAPGGRPSSCGDKKDGKRPAAAPARAGALAHPRRRVASKLAPGGLRHRRDNSAGRGLRSTRCRREGCCRLGFRHCRRAVVPSFGARHPDTIRRPGAGRGPGL